MQHRPYLFADFFTPTFCKIAANLDL